MLDLGNLSSGERVPDFFKSKQPMHPNLCKNAGTTFQKAELKDNGQLWGKKKENIGMTNGHTGRW